MHLSPQRWYELANTYKPAHGKTYGWVLDYAKFRLQFTFGNGRYIEEKSLELVKILVAMSAAIWAAFSWLLSKGIVLAFPTNLLMGTSIGLLLLSGIFLLQAFGPSDRPVPLAEDVALRAIEQNESGDGAIANFSLTMTAATEYQSQITCKKGKMMRRAIWLIYFSLAGFTLSLCYQMFLKMFLLLHPVAGR